MTYIQLKRRKEKLFIRIMSDKYKGVQTPSSIIREYRFLQREQIRMIRKYKGVA